MTKYEIIQELIDTHFIENYTAKMLVNKEEIPLDDAIQECWLAILTIDEERLINWYEEGGINKVRQVAAGIINRQCRSTSSKLYYTYCKKSTDNLIIKRTNDQKQIYSEEGGWQE